MPSEPHWPQISPPLLSLAAALKVVQERASEVLSNSTPQIETCNLADALGRVLALELRADRDQPPFPRVTRDGFAVRAADVAGTPLRVIGQMRAGEGWQGNPLQTGEAIEIMTGCALPSGTDAVLMVEHIELSGNRLDAEYVTPQRGRDLHTGDNVVAEGSEARRGDLLLSAGTRLHPQQIALAASCGWRDLRVYRQPRVAILSTGDELREPSLEPQMPNGMEVGAVPKSNGGAEAKIEPHCIYDSNSHMLAALVQKANGVPLRHSAVADHPGQIAVELRNALDAVPLTLVTGGVSMGRYDLVEEAFGGLGAEFFFTGVKIRPGKPAVFGRVPAAGDRPERFFFALPGNPVSAMVTFRLFVEPFLAALGGERTWQPRFASAILASDVHSKPGLTQFLPAFLDSRQSQPEATPIPTRGSGDLAANARANCYVVVPEKCDSLPAGATVRILLI
jgi:molybdopterin molybdotransferase